MPEDESQPEQIKNYGIIPMGEEYRKELEKELDDLIRDQDILPTQYKERRIVTLSARLSRNSNGDREGTKS